MLTVCVSVSPVLWILIAPPTPVVFALLPVKVLVPRKEIVVALAGSFSSEMAPPSEALKLPVNVLLVNVASP